MLSSLALPREELLREEVLQEQPGFETLLFEISSRFVTAPPDVVDFTIEDSLRLICQDLGVDESTIYLRDVNEPDTYVLSYVLRDPELPPPPKTRFTAKDNFPWCNQKLIANEVICLPDTQAAPPEAAVDMAMWKTFGIHSALVIPLSTGGQPPLGFWGIDSTSCKRDWPEPLQKRLKIIADVFAGALERAHRDRQLRESEARLRLAANATGAGFWTIDAKTGVVWVTAKLRELFGLNADESVDLVKYFSVIHPDDRESVQRMIDSIRSGREETVEYRIVSTGDSCRWLMSRGSRCELSGKDSVALLGYTVDITDRRTAEDALRGVSARLIEAQEQERKRIARELHDSIGQQVALIAMGIRQLCLLDDQVPEARRDGIAQLLKDTDKALQEIGALSHELHSASLEFLGLAAAIQGFCHELRTRHDVDIVLTQNKVPRALPPEVALAVFRITQEALHNALKHSGATHFEVRLQQQGAYIELTVSDSGAGFDPDKAIRGQGLGLISMRERAMALKGEVTLRSQPGRGTEIHARIPF